MDDFSKEIMVQATTEIAKDAYSDTVHPAAQNLGEIFGTITGFFNHVVMYPLKLINNKYELKAKEFRERLENDYKNIPEQNVAEPDLHIVGPALESLKYNIMDDDLANMFANLLISNMDTDTKGLCTPAFIRIIEQMSPNDAKVFKAIYEYCQKNPGVAVCEIKFVLDENKDRIATVQLPKHIVDINLFQMDPYQISKSIQMLARLGLVDIDYLTSFVDDKVYQKLIEQDYYKTTHNLLESKTHKKFIPTINIEGIITINELSQDFATVCLRKK